MEEHPLNQSSPKRAYKDTKLLLRNSIMVSLGVVVVIVGTFVYLATIITPDDANKFVSAAYPAIGSVVGVIVGLGIIWLVMLQLAPYKQRNEARSALERLKNWESFLKNIRKGDTITNKIINVPLLFQLQGRDTITSVTFNRCIFRGFCSIMFEGGEVKGADFQEKLDECFIEVSRVGTYKGLVKFVFCKFEYCRFESISIVGFKSDYDKLKKNSIEL